MTNDFTLNEKANIAKQIKNINVADVEDEMNKRFRQTP